MKKITLTLLCTSAILLGCAHEEKPQLLIADHHTAENSLDWAGSYEGVFPCADCEGIRTKVTLQADKRYILEEEYLTNRPGIKQFTHSGHFEFQSDNTSLIRLDDQAEQRFFFVGENYLEARQMESGDAIVSNLNYTLKKQ